MTTDLRPGRITSFRREQAFGLITLDDGTQVKFDAGICTMVPEEGAAVRLRVGPAKWGGGFKALYVEPVEASPVAADAPARSLDDLLAAVQRENLANELSERVLEELVAQRFGGRPEDGTILALLDAYYAGDPARARGDGYLRRDAGLPPESDDVLAELAARLPNAKLPRQVRWSGRGAARSPRDESQIATVPYDKLDPAMLAESVDAPLLIPALVVADPDGRERSVEIASLDDVIEVANAALRRAGDGRRVYKLQTGGSWYAYLAIGSDRALRLASTLPFAPPPADVA